MYASLAIGIILSGGPYSVYESDAPSIDPAVFELDIPILGQTSPTHSFFVQAGWEHRDNVLVLEYSPEG